ncbi:MAG: YeeE/YedE thiosulfate transporter family protein, partial [Campylobacterota bacterium]
GSLFGIGMMIADGCTNRHLIKFAQGDIHSLITLIFVALFAFATTQGFLYGVLEPFINSEILISISSIFSNTTMNIYVVLAILIAALAFVLKKSKRLISLYDGVIIGLLISAGWYVTAIIGSEAFERVIPFASVSFVYPTAKSFELFSFYEVNNLTFGISIVLGVLIGAFAMSKFNKKYSFGCTANQNTNKVKNNMIGGALMGTGGILSIGCTVGQGLTGLSTLAFASAVAIISIFISAVITALFLNKKDKLPMCFIFDWEDNHTDYQI